MSKKIYVPSSGLSHKTAKLRVGVNNISRNITKGYIGINGVARQFWPDEPIYVWNRYEKVEHLTYNCTYNMTGGSSPTWVKNTAGRFATSGNFDTNTGKITLSDVFDYDYNWLSKNTSMTAKTFYIIDFTSKYSLGTSPNEIYSTAAEAGVFDKWYRVSVTSTNHIMQIIAPIISSTVDSYTRGNYIDQITSKTGGAYPNDGIQGDYWYVYVGER